MIRTLCHTYVGLYFLKIIIIFIIGYFLASHYRPFQNEHSFFDFGLADSGVGLFSFMVVYFSLTPPSVLQSKAKYNALAMLVVYLSQELYCYFFPGFVGTFDFKDVIYCLMGYVVIYWWDVKSRRVL